MWDVGGQDRLRPLWRHYYPKTNALVYVIDSSDTERFEESKKHLYKVIQELKTTSSAKGVLLLVFANKQDLPGAKTAKELAEMLELKSLMDSEYYAVIGSNALTGQGLVEGLSWLSITHKQTSQESS